MSYLTQEERKQPISHMCNYFTFKSCADLSQGVKITAITGNPKYKENPNLIAQDVACFTCWWVLTFRENLNGFAGLDTIKWEVE